MNNQCLEQDSVEESVELGVLVSSVDSDSSTVLSAQHLRLEPRASCGDIQVVSQGVSLERRFKKAYSLKN